jgi:hypothetical protein
MPARHRAGFRGRVWPNGVIADESTMPVSQIIADP